MRFSWLWERLCCFVWLGFLCYGFCRFHNVILKDKSSLPVPRLWASTRPLLSEYKKCCVLNTFKCGTTDLANSSRELANVSRDSAKEEGVGGGRGTHISLGGSGPLTPGRDLACANNSWQSSLRSLKRVLRTTEICLTWNELLRSEIGDLRCGMFSEMYRLKYDIWYFGPVMGPFKGWCGPLSPGIGSLRPGMYALQLERVRR